MSEFTPSVQNARESFSYTVHDSHLEVNRAEGRAMFDRLIAEVEHAAAEEAWERFVDVLSAHHEDRAPNVVADMERRNPYRRNEGENND